MPSARISTIQRASRSNARKKSFSTSPRPGNRKADFKRNGKTVGVATGFIDLDRKLGGLHPSDLSVLAGRPSMGKTSLATNIAFCAAKSYKPSSAPELRKIAEDGAVVGFFSLEMSAEQLAT